MERGNARGIQGEAPSGVGQEAQGGGGSTAVVPAKATARTVKPVRTIDAVAGAVLDLDAAIERRREELSILEQAREIVARG